MSGCLKKGNYPIVLRELMKIVNKKKWLNALDSEAQLVLIA